MIDFFPTLLIPPSIANHAPRARIFHGIDGITASSDGIPTECHSDRTLMKNLSEIHRDSVAFSMFPVCVDLESSSEVCKMWGCLKFKSENCIFICRRLIPSTMSKYCPLDGSLLPPNDNVFSAGSWENIPGSITLSLFIARSRLLSEMSPLNVPGSTL